MEEVREERWERWEREDKRKKGLEEVGAVETANKAEKGEKREREGREGREGGGGFSSLFLSLLPFAFCLFSLKRTGRVSVIRHPSLLFLLVLSLLPYYTVPYSRSSVQHCRSPWPKRLGQSGPALQYY